MAAPDDTPDDIDALRAALAAEQVARCEAEARASGAEALVLQLKLLIAKLSTTSSAPPPSAAASSWISWNWNSANWSPRRPSSPR